MFDLFNPGGCFDHEKMLKHGKECQEESKKEYLKKSPKEKARCQRFYEVIFQGNTICPHCKKDILEEKKC